MMKNLIVNLIESPHYVTVYITFTTLREKVNYETIVFVQWCNMLYSH